MIITMEKNTNVLDTAYKSVGIFYIHPSDYVFTMIVIENENTYKEEQKIIDQQVNKLPTLSVLINSLLFYGYKITKTE